MDNSTCGIRKVAACLTVQYTIDNRSSAGDFILIGPGIYSETITISKNLTFKGAFFGRTFLDGNSSGTVVSILRGVTASMESLTIRNGYVSTAVVSSIAGGINNEGELSLRATIVTGNSVNASKLIFTPMAGGILNQGTLSLSDSIVSYNVAGGGCAEAGGILNYSGTVTIDHSLIAENKVLNLGICGVGPGSMSTASGYYNMYGNSVVKTTTFWKNGIVVLGSLAIDRSTVSDSDAHGIVNGGGLTVINSTITGSTGSGIVNMFTALIGVVQMSNSTVAENAGDGVVFGAPLYSKIRNSILAANGGSDCKGDFFSGDYNLVQNMDGCRSYGGSHDITGVSAELRRLGWYGGPTQTMELRRRSPAIDAGDPSGCKDGAGNLILTDQRGLPRPERRGGRCDIGAVEVQRDRMGW
jgi:hypothetical protein